MGVSCQPTSRRITTRSNLRTTKPTTSISTPGSWLAKNPRESGRCSRGPCGRFPSSRTCWRISPAKPTLAKPLCRGFCPLALRPPTIARLDLHRPPAVAGGVGLYRLRKNPACCHPEEPKPVLNETKEGPLYLLENSNTGVLRFAQEDSIGVSFRSLFGPAVQATHKYPVSCGPRSPDDSGLRGP